MYGSNSKSALRTVTILLTLVLAACGGSGDGNTGTPAPQGLSNTGTTTGSTIGSASAAQLLSLTGAPNRQALANQPYWFRPVANDINGARLLFGIANQPKWSNFNSLTGEITGTPTSGDVGLYHGVTVTVTAGTQLRALSFDIEVVQVGTNSVMVSWLAPTENEDGTPLTNLAGYRIRFGQQSGNYTSTINVDNPGLASYVVSGLAAGTYYLVLSAVNTNGAESSYSNEAQVNLG